MTVIRSALAVGPFLADQDSNRPLREAMPLTAKLSRAGAIISTYRNIDRTFRQLFPEATLIKFCHERALQLIAFVEER